MLTIFASVALIILGFMLISSVWEEFRKVFFTKFYTIISVIVDKLSGKWKPLYFKEFQKLKPKALDDKLRVLEVGPARGFNFKFYPRQTKLVALDYNNHFQEYFMREISMYPNIELESYVTGVMEDMSAVQDNSIDAAITSYVLCSVKDQKKAMKEMLRVLKPGGTYFFMEHVAYSQKYWVDTIYLCIQYFLQPLWYAIFGGCHCQRKSWICIENAGFRSVELNFSYPDNFPFICRPHIWGYATK